MSKRRPDHSRPVTLDRARGIFGNARPPKGVWEAQFDGLHDALDRMATTPLDEIDRGDLWYYHHDLAFVELQPDLFQYLFPLCLWDWHLTLLEGQPCSHGDSEFHFAVLHGDIFKKMVTAEQREQVDIYLRDSLLEALDQQADRLSFHIIPNVQQRPWMGWMPRLNSLGLISPNIEQLWSEWWSIATPGRAVAAIQWIASLMYDLIDSPLVEPASVDLHRGGFTLWGNDSYAFSEVWLPPNIEFFQREITLERVEATLGLACDRLQNTSEAGLAAIVVQDFAQRKWIAEYRLAELKTALADPSSVGHDWSV